MKREAKAASSWLDPDFEAEWPTPVPEWEAKWPESSGAAHSSEKTAKKRPASARVIGEHKRLKDNDLKTCK